MSYKCPFCHVKNQFKCFVCPFCLPPAYRYDHNMCCLSSLFIEHFPDLAIDHLVHYIKLHSDVNL